MAVRSVRRDPRKDGLVCVKCGRLVLTVGDPPVCLDCMETLPPKMADGLLMSCRFCTAQVGDGG